MVAGGLHWLSALQPPPDDPPELEDVEVVPPEVEVVAPLLELLEAAGHWQERLTRLQVNGVHWVSVVHWSVESQKPTVPLRGMLQKVLAHWLPAVQVEQIAPLPLDDELLDEVLVDEEPLLLELDELPAVVLTVVPVALEEEDEDELEWLVPELLDALWLPDVEDDEPRPVLPLALADELPVEVRPVDDPEVLVTPLEPPGTHLPWSSQTTPAR
jgi:hypothetical protein